MTTQNNFEAWGNKDITTYYKWLNKKTANNEDYSYTICASVNPYECYDAVQIKTDTEGYIDLSFVELKGRNISITDYEDCIVEDYKIKKLIQLSVMTNKPVYLVALYYVDSKLAIWKLNENTEYYTEVINCQWHTADGSGNKKNKEMAKLPLSEAKIYRF